MHDEAPAESLIYQSPEKNGRRFMIEVRPGMTEGNYLGLAFRRWGKGHWCETHGEPAFMTRREDAMGLGETWLEKGM